MLETLRHIVQEVNAAETLGEALEIIAAAGGKPAGVLLALDRQEKGTGELSAVQEIEQQAGIPVLSIIQLADLVEHLEKQPDSAEILASVTAYRDRYGV